MKDLTILYASCTCSEKKYKDLFELVENKPGQQVQKYHRLFAKGFAKNGCRVMMVSALPVNRENSLRKKFKFEEESEQGIEYHYLPLFNFPVIKNISAIWSSFWETIKNAGKNTYVICDVLNQSVALGALCAARLKKKHCVGIVTDLPDMLVEKKSIKTRVNNWVLSKYTDYVFLTEAMNDRLNPKGKPYVVLEGHVDCDIPMCPPEEKYDKFTGLYAGELSKKYGLQYLVEGFIQADIKDAELHLYGYGDYVPELLTICEKYQNVKYFGVQLNSYVVKEQQKATLLINPRPTHEEYTKYSFPSKNMEYMLSGTPVLTTKLPGMPEEYYPYVYIIEEENANGVAASIRAISEVSREALKEKGIQAREFVMKHKNCQYQARQVIDGLMKGN